MASIGIYKITSPSNKVYIGQSWRIKRRFNDYRNYENVHQTKLYNSFLKYGVNKHQFNIIHELPNDISQEIMNIYEGLYMQQYKECGIELLNIREAGSNGKHSSETKIKLKKATVVSQFKKGNIPWMQGRKHTLESKIIMLEAAKKGGSVKGIKHSDEAKIKMSKSKKGKASTNRKKVICTISGVIYDSIEEASKSINTNQRTLQGYLCGFRKNKTSLKYFING